MHVPRSFDPDGAAPSLRLAVIVRPRDADPDLARLRAFSPVETALVLACRVRPSRERVDAPAIISLP
jgi:hypothetical protein